MAQAGFNKHYLFLKKNTVVIKHHGGKHLRAKPGNLEEADPDGGHGEFAQWEADPEKGNKIRLKSHKSGKYLRIVGGDKVDVGGVGGKFCVFKYHKDGDHVKLESCEFGGKYIAVGKDNKVRVGVGGPFCKLEIFRK
eukprot:CAMPEP_0197032742 /NCGR_PEP_ID=MMETSP1384-20130603/11341_1 /TAXON_ID=29189 /ORGANISM="Ammonia sp." /LENGTH=136 /DNA_ID=CAMNT_0042462445 /DNA_START=68 /DNA_END=478 /DNA_ORIENTATION=+